MLDKYNCLLAGGQEIISKDGIPRCSRILRTRRRRRTTCFRVSHPSTLNNAMVDRDTRIDGALYPWSNGLLKRLLEISPLPPGIEITAESEVPPPRVLLSPASQKSVLEQKDPLEADILSHKGVVSVNSRTTSKDWYQDVRHIEIEFDHDVQ